MDKNRSIKTRFWIDNWVLDLDPVEKLLYIYLLTNEATNLAGIYELHLRKMAFETGIDREMIGKILARFEADKKIIYKHDYVFIKNFTKHQAYNPKMLINVKQTIDNLPDKIINDSELTGYIYPIQSLYIPMGEIEMEIEMEIESKMEMKSEIAKKNNEMIIFPFSGNEFLNLWKMWKEYRQKEHSFKYKTAISENTALARLSELAGNDTEKARKIIMQSIQNGWKGFFELRPEQKKEKFITYERKYE